MPRQGLSESPGDPFATRERRILLALRRRRLIRRAFVKATDRSHSRSRALPIALFIDLSRMTLRPSRDYRDNRVASLIPSAV